MLLFVKNPWKRTFSQKVLVTSHDDVITNEIWILSDKGLLHTDDIYQAKRSREQCVMCFTCETHHIMWKKSGVNGQKNVPCSHRTVLCGTEVHGIAFWRCLNRGRHDNNKESMFTVTFTTVYTVTCIILLSQYTPYIWRILKIIPQIYLFNM